MFEEGVKTIADALTGPAKRRMTSADFRAREAAEAGYEEFWRAPTVKEKIDAWMAEAFPDLPAFPATIPDVPDVPEDAPGDFSDAVCSDDDADSVFEPQRGVSVEDLIREMEKMGPAVFDFVDTTEETVGTD